MSRQPGRGWPGIQPALQCGNGQTDKTDKTGFHDFLDNIFDLGLSVTQIWCYWNLLQDLLLKKNMFEICSNRVRSARTHVPASGMPLKLYLEVHLGHVETLNAPSIEISKAEKIHFTPLHSHHHKKKMKKKSDYTSFTLFPSGNLISSFSQFRPKKINLRYSPTCNTS